MSSLFGEPNKGDPGLSIGKDVEPRNRDVTTGTNEHNRYLIQEFTAKHASTRSQINMH
jgi:hypothetical protein